MRNPHRAAGFCVLLGCTLASSPSRADDPWATVRLRALPTIDSKGHFAFEGGLGLSISPLRESHFYGGGDLGFGVDDELHMRLAVTVHAEYLDEPREPDSRWGVHSGLALGLLGTPGFKSAAMLSPSTPAIVTRVDPTVLYRITGGDENQLAFGFGLALGYVFSVNATEGYFLVGPSLSLEYLHQSRVH